MATESTKTGVPLDRGGGSCGSVWRRPHFSVNIRIVTSIRARTAALGFHGGDQGNNAVRRRAVGRLLLVWLSQTGPRTYAAPVHKTWAEMVPGPNPKMKDQAADIARIGVRITDCTGELAPGDR